LHLSHFTDVRVPHIRVFFNLPHRCSRGHRAIDAATPSRPCSEPDSPLTLQTMRDPFSSSSAGMPKAGAATYADGQSLHLLT
jgi:hypothetical protein